MKLARFLIVGLALVAISNVCVFAGDRDDDIEKILKKYDEKFRQLREEMKRELERLAGGGKETPAETGAPWIGIDAEPLKEGLRVLLNLDKGQGLVVLGVSEGGPADKAGIRKLDILLVFDGVKIGDVEGLKKALGKTSPGSKVEVVILRNGETQKMNLHVGGRGSAPEKPLPGETPKGRLAKVRENLKELLEGGTEGRMRARRFFEEMLKGSGEDQDKALAQIEEAAEDLLGKLPKADREEMRKVFKDMMKGFKHAIQKPKPGPGSQKKEDIESFLEEMLGGKKPAPAPDDQDDIDKLLDELLGKKDGAKKDGDKKDGDKKDGGKTPAEAGDLPVNIPPEWDKALEDILGKEMWARLKNMMKSPEYSEMLKQFFPDGFEFTPANVKKLLSQYGIELDQLPDRLREMGVEEEAIGKIMKLLEKEDAALPKKGGKPWMGISAKEADGKGVLISGVTDQGPGSDAGLKEGDLIISAGGKPVKNKEDLKKALEGKRAGDTVRIVVRRGNREITKDLELGEK